MLISVILLDRDLFSYSPRVFNFKVLGVVRILYFATSLLPVSYLETRACK